MIRRQLTLFVPPEASAAIEAVRRDADPVQHALIAAHVTLAREDELAALDADEIGRRLTASPSLVLRFGLVERFDGHGLWLPCVGGEDAFHALRDHLLGPSRRHRPHLTLAHPRNPQAPGNALATAHGLPVPLAIAFPRVARIEQRDGAPWVRLADYALG